MPAEFTSNELKISEERIIKAANKCPTAKNVLMVLFPEVFEVNVLKFLNKNGYKYILETIEIVDEFINGEYFIKIPLPSANTEWTFEAYDTVKSIVSFLIENGYEAFPVHQRIPSFNHADFIYIKIEKGRYGKINL